jgi:hypothetical protein
MSASGHSAVSGARRGVPNHCGLLGEVPIMNPLLRGISLCRTAVARLAAFMGHLSGWGFIACSLFISGDVLARAFLGFSSKATTEITGYMLAFGIA